MAVWRCLGGRLLVIEQELVDDRLEGPRTGAVRFRSRGMHLGSGCFKIFRIVFRECSNSRAIRLMGIPSR